MPEGTIRSTVDLHPSTKRKLEELAATAGLTQSAVLREAIEQVYVIVEAVREGGEVVVNRPGKDPIKLARFEIIFK